MKFTGCITHGMSSVPEYRVWAAMKDRCSNHKNPYYKNYGGRGIQVCTSWEVFDVFIKDMGRRPSSKYSIERKNNDEGYYAANCKWALRPEQDNNTSRCRYITIDGETLTYKNWDRKMGNRLGTVSARKGLGWSDSDAVLKPVRKRRTILAKIGTMPERQLCRKQLARMKKHGIKSI